jgi:hypothetical protein
MLVRRKGSGKWKRRFYEVFEFEYGESLSDLANFLGDLGEISRGQDSILIDMYTWIDLKDGRRICPNQYLVKDWNSRILSFDPTIFL